MKGRDGKTDIYGLMFTPSKLDSTRKYPIINYIYPGPQSGSVGPRSFSPARGDNQALAELGFVVVAIDGMGTPGRSKAFHDTYYGRMGDNTIPDQVAGIKELAQRYAFIDVDKAGIWGHSGGGFATASAMFRSRTSSRWASRSRATTTTACTRTTGASGIRVCSTKNGSSDNYAAESNATYAKNLKGKLLLVHGRWTTTCRRRTRSSWWTRW